MPLSLAKESPAKINYQNVKISPGGKYLAISLTFEGRSSLVFRDRETNETLGLTNFPKQLMLGDYHWVNNERVVFKINNKVEWSTKPQFYGELYAIDFDGVKADAIYGFGIGEQQTGSRAKKKKSIFGWGDIIDILPSDKKHILISSTPMNSIKESQATVYKLNVYTGLIKNRVAKSPLSASSFMTNSAGEITSVTGISADNQLQLMIRHKDQWQDIGNVVLSNNAKVIPRIYSEEYLYIFDDDAKGERALYRFNITDKSYEAINADINIKNFEKYSMQHHAKDILQLEKETTTFLTFNNKQEQAQTYKQLMNTFPKEKVAINSRANIGGLYIVSVYKNASSGVFYLYNKDKNQLKYLHNFKQDLTVAEYSSVTNEKNVSVNDITLRLYPSGYKG